MKSKTIDREIDFIQHALLLALLLLNILLAACSPGHNGGNVIGFIRDGALWTIDPNGENAFENAADAPRIVDFAWSPTHQLLVYRTLDADFAKTAEGQQLKVRNLSGGVGDVPSVLNTLSVDGGSPIPTAYSSRDIRYNNPTWNSNGSRLLYRTTSLEPPDDFHAIGWSISQNDQPARIAVKPLPASYAIPSLSYDSNSYRALGDSDLGPFTSTLSGDQVRNLTSAALPGHPLPASLERVLWRPAHQDQELLYAVTVPTFAAPQGDALVVQLILRTLAGHESVLTTCQCKQFAWSPDGRFVLFNTAEGYTLFNVDSRTTWNVPIHEQSIPYWSPDSQFLLLDGEHTLQLLTPASKQQQTLLSDGHAKQSSQANAETLPSQNALLNPVSNSLWSADSRHFLFLTRDRLQWQEHDTLNTGQGLYTVSIDDKGRPQDKPALVTKGNITQAGWTYQDANTSFLY